MTCQNLAFSVLLSATLTLLGESAKAQIRFKCDSSFQFDTDDWPGYSKIYDSLNRIDFSKQHFELRIWEYTPGHAGMVHDVFVLRHYKGSKGWRGFYYSAFKDGRTHKSMEEYFSDNELTAYSKEDWESVWDTLISYNILDIEPPSQQDLLDSYGFMVRTSHDTRFSIELLQKDCKKRYGFSYGTARYGPFDEIPEFIALRKIVALRQKWIKVNIGSER